MHEPIVDWPRLARLSGAGRGIFVLAPHPDDECIGTGALIAHARMRGVRVEVALLTDGAASHPRSRQHGPARLAAIRLAEMRAALRCLGQIRPLLTLDLPDSASGTVADAQWQGTRRRLRAAIVQSGAGLVVTTWRREPHRDHRSAYRLLRQAMYGLPATLAECLVWTPITGTRRDRPSAREGRLVHLTVGAARPRKVAALRAHRSQFGAVVGDDPDGFCIDPATFRAMTGPHESYVLER
ncbi:MULTISPECIES: PIG-L deacetylase family protein [unclassified Roseitalea]|uniref:PIG-L deacetylase family protein n=1 Tax=unclassified Roseitalea TaxID=2639107 RepID=UPI00273F8733|nr:MULTISPECIES: PIG-L deacetylase family protein [unclassified Roseitalea]